MDLADGQQPGATEIFECNIYAKYKQRKGGFFGTDLNGYDGIPQNLVLNIIGWMVSYSIHELPCSYWKSPNCPN